MALSLDSKKFALTISALLVVIYSSATPASAQNDIITPDEISATQALKMRAHHENLDVSLNKDDTINLIDHMSIAQNDKIHALIISDVSDISKITSDGVMWKIVFVNCATKQVLLFEHARFNFGDMDWVRYNGPQSSWYSPAAHSPWARAIAIECS